MLILSQFSSCLSVFAYIFVSFVVVLYLCIFVMCIMDVCCGGAIYVCVVLVLFCGDSVVHLLVVRDGCACMRYFCCGVWGW